MGFGNGMPISEPMWTVKQESFTKKKGGLNFRL